MKKKDSEILIFCTEDNIAVEIELSIKQKELHSKLATDMQSCVAWLNMRSFGLVIIYDTIGNEKIKSVVEKVWKLNPIARVLIIGAKGSISVESLLLGAEVIFGPDYQKELNQLLDRYVESVTTQVSPTHVLVVEDLDSPREIICMFLEGLGYDQVTGVASAQAALDLLKEQPGRFTTVLTDVRMPHMSGAELIKEIRRSAQLNRLPVIALTAYGTADCLFECLEAGASGFLVKPPKKADLQRELGRAERVRRSGATSRLVPRDQVQQLRSLLSDKGLL